ncbi:DUF2892 domain-containing protein [candidate division WOR-3 bacterium]|jgi:uncharacterized membrane protein YkgB|nr:DUF2892 domain-containing protein [candidate division WOR-3 bacterium]
MKHPSPNVGNSDKMVRLTIGIIFVMIALLIPLILWKWIFGLLGGILLITSITRQCLIYRIFHINTYKGDLENKE